MKEQYWRIECGIKHNPTNIYWSGYKEEEQSDSSDLDPLPEKAMAPTPVLLPGKSHGWKTQVGWSPWGHNGEGNGTPLQCSCLGNPMDGGVCWAAVHGVTTEKAMAPTSVLLPGESHGRRSLVRLQLMGSRRVGHDWVTSLSLFTFMHWRRKWQPTPVFLPGESQGQ